MAVSTIAQELVAERFTDDEGAPLPEYPDKHMFKNMSDPANQAMRQRELESYFHVLLGRAMVLPRPSRSLFVRD